MRHAFALVSLLAVACGAQNGDLGPKDDAAAAVDLATSSLDLAGIDLTGADLTGADGSVSPEICTGGIDEDGDKQIDCADSDCAFTADCMAADVAAKLPGLTPCGSALAFAPSASKTACGTIAADKPPLDHPVNCAWGELTTTIQYFCSGAAITAAWVHETYASQPGETQMLAPMTFLLTSYDASPNVWETLYKGGSGGPTGAVTQLHYFLRGAGSGTVTDSVTLRAVVSGDLVSRLFLVDHSTMTFVVGMTPSMSTHDFQYAGGTRFTVP